MHIEISQTLQALLKGKNINNSKSYMEVCKRRIRIVDWQNLGETCESGEASRLPKIYFQH